MALNDEVRAPIPGALLAAMRADLPALADEIVHEIEATVPGYERSTGPRHRYALRTAVRRTLTCFFADADDPRLAETYRAIGRSEHRVGRSVDAMHAAYWIGVRLSWRRWTQLGHDLGMPLPSVYRLGEAVLAHACEAARWGAEGYASAQALAGDQLVKARHRLLDLLFSPVPVPPETVDDAARTARWTVPETAAVVVYGGDGPGLRVALPVDVLRGGGEDPFLVVPGGADRTAAAARWISATRTVVAGPVVPVTDLRSSLRVATDCLELVRRGVLTAPPPGGVLRAADHLDAVLLLRDEEVLGPLVDLHLRPLSALSANQQNRIVDTVLAWLSCGGRVPQAAAQLGVHPQTVHYRLRQARTVLGADALGNPANRLELEMALRIRQLLRGRDRPVRAG